MGLVRGEVRGEAPARAEAGPVGREAPDRGAPDRGLDMVDIILRKARKSQIVRPRVAVGESRGTRTLLSADRACSDSETQACRSGYHLASVLL
ncbi:hypothetical protein GCM10010467_26990 [Actinocorallia glomerata]|uniref:Uncharacterized protein n=2 Tax=Actinomycetes TaxID=1760 RepID=A0ABP6LRB7_9MICC